MEQNMNNLDVNGLSEAAVAAIAHFARLGDADRAAALKLLGISRGARIWTPRTLGAVPTMTGLVQERDREAIYASSEWSAEYMRGSTAVAYALQAKGLGDLSVRLEGLSLTKVGTAAKNNLVRRVGDLGSYQYGAWHRAGRRYERAEGFEVFQPAPRLQLAPQHPHSPVTLSSYGIEVDLPRGMTGSEFEAALNEKLLSLRLHVFADSEAGSALCARTGVHPTELRRFYKDASRFKAATELTLMRPQADIVALAKIYADIVIDRVLGLVSKRPSL